MAKEVHPRTRISRPVIDAVTELTRRASAEHYDCRDPSCSNANGPQRSVTVKSDRDPGLSEAECRSLRRPAQRSRWGCPISTVADSRTTRNCILPSPGAQTLPGSREDEFVRH